MDTILGIARGAVHLRWTKIREGRRLLPSARKTQEGGNLLRLQRRRNRRKDGHWRAARVVEEKYEEMKQFLGVRYVRQL